MKMAVFWVVGPCSLVKVYHRFRGPQRTTRRYNPEDSHLEALCYLITLNTAEHT
jgi:hypothetical protein